MKRIECINEKYNSFINDLLNGAAAEKDYYFLFGSGIMGLQVAEKLNACGQYNYCFIDNNADKQGTEIDNHPVESMEYLIREYNRSKVIIVCVEAYDAIERQLADAGYKKNEDYYIVADGLSDEFIKAIDAINEGDTLLLGDCSLINVSMEEVGGQSTATLVAKNSHLIKPICYNSLYSKTYYYLLRLLENLNKRPAKLFVWIDCETLNPFYSRYPKAQNSELLKRLEEKYGESSRMAERQAWKSSTGKMAELKDISSPNRQSNDMQEIAQIRLNHFRLNYLYNLKPDAESVIYLEAIIKWAEETKVKSTIVIAPINIKGVRKEAPSLNFERLEKTINWISNIESDWVNVVNLTEALEASDFISHFSFNEGIRGKGRLKISDIIAGETE